MVEKDELREAKFCLVLNLNALLDSTLFFSNFVCSARQHLDGRRIKNKRGKIP